MLKDALSTPAATGQINGTGLRQANAVTESTALELPGPSSLRLEYKQGAGEAAKRPADRIKAQYHRGRTPIPLDRQSQHSSARPSVLHAHPDGKGVALTGSRQRLSQLAS